MTCGVFLQSNDLQTYQIQVFTATGRSGQHSDRLQYEFFTPGDVGTASQGYASVVAEVSGLTISQLVQCRQATSMCVSMLMSSLHISTVNRVGCWAQISGTYRIRSQRWPCTASNICCSHQ